MFAVCGEEFGLIGRALLLVLSLLLIGRAFVITMNASTLFTRLVAGAITLMFFSYAFVNTLSPTIPTALVPSNASVNTTSLFSATPPPGK